MAVKKFDAIALYPFPADKEGDLELNVGDEVRVTRKVWMSLHCVAVALTCYLQEDTGWWYGENNRTGLEGYFPTSYVKVVSSDA